jgi:hypothetical protein
LTRTAVLGVRHHGPGSARSVVAALDEVRPAIVLIEGPSDADRLLRFVGHQDMTPPLALFAYDPKEPRASAFWPFGSFSPEWQALRWAAEHEVPARFCDLPSGAFFDEPESKPGRELRVDPIGMLAHAAG